MDEAHTPLANTFNMLLEEEILEQRRGEGGRIISELIKS